MTLVHLLLNLYILVFIVTALLSWFPASSGSGGLATVRGVLAQLTEPVLRPLRQILPRPHLGGVAIDLSVLVAIFGLKIINAIV